MAAVKKVDVKDVEKSLFESVQKGNVGEVLRLLNEKDTRVDCLDENGMTPLQHAAYRGNKELCDLLLDRGADVNSNHHEHGYTALMFAALAGSTKVTSLLLNAGASKTAMNSVGRNAAQMAAFVGNHSCVSIINNFVPKEDLEYYTVVRGLEAEPHLPQKLVTPLHLLLVQPSVHPVFVSLFLQQHPALLDNAEKVVRVLELMCEREIKQKEANEVLALKFHFFAYLIKNCHKLVSAFQTKRNQHSETQSTDEIAFLDDVIKHWLKGREGDGFPENLEKLVRQGIREFPYAQCSIIQQLVRSLAPVKIGDEPTALGMLTSSICGQRHSDDEVSCSTCGNDNAVKKCSACKSVQYCNQQCQRLHWFVHKKRCVELAADYRKRQESLNRKSEPLIESSSPGREKSVTDEENATSTTKNGQEELKSNTEPKISSTDLTKDQLEE